MATSPEFAPKEVPQIQERQEEFIVNENLQTSGVKVVQKNFKSQITNNSGQPVVTTPPTQVVSVTPPYDDTTLLAQSKGDVSSSLTWLAGFWLRVIKKAMHFGWQIVSGSPNPPITN
jgi:hypothetical protein